MNLFCMRNLVLPVTVLLLVWPASGATNVAVFNFQMTSDTPEWKWLEKGLSDRIATDFTRSKTLSADLLSWFTKRPAGQILAELPVWTRSVPATRALYEGMDLYQVAL